MWISIHVMNFDICQESCSTEVSNWGNIALTLTWTTFLSWFLLWFYLIYFMPLSSWILIQYYILFFLDTICPLIYCIYTNNDSLLVYYSLYLYRFILHFFVIVISYPTCVYRLSIAITTYDSSAHVLWKWFLHFFIVWLRILPCLSLTSV